MADDFQSQDKATLDKDLEKYTFIESATRFVLKRGAAPGVGVIFLALSALVATMVVTGNPEAAAIIAASAIAAYMAMNIGANDVTNNVGAAVGAGALSMSAALLIAAVAEIAGAMLAGGDVVQTLKSGIISTELIQNPGDLITAMTAALLAAAIWINIATWLNAPVSTTHSIIGAIIGAGVATVGAAAMQWWAIAQIALAWVVSPILGGLIAVLFQYFIEEMIIYRDDKLAAARRWLPPLLAIMAGAFSAFLMLKGLGRFFHPSPEAALGIGFGIGLASYPWFNQRIRIRSANLENRNASLKILFRIPLIFAAALLSFAHGANDVANAIGPLAAIVEAAGIQSVATNLDAPFWIMLIGAMGISVGLLLFGPRLIRIVGSQITKLNPMRAFSVSMSAAITVLIASVLGLPVSSTHIAVGSVFGIGFFREWYVAHSPRRRAYMLARQAVDGKIRKPKGPIDDYDDTDSEDSRYRYLVRRSHFMSIMAAWVVTVPTSGLLAALVTAIMMAFRFKG